MNYMKEILSQIKIRPGMFLADCNLENLYAFMNGYMYRIFQEKDIVPEFYPGFQEYIEKKFDINTGQHWAKILDFYSDSEEEALKNFFLYLEEYTRIEEEDNREK